METSARRNSPINYMKCRMKYTPCLFMVVKPHQEGLVWLCLFYAWKLAPWLSALDIDRGKGFFFNSPFHVKHMYQSIPLKCLQKKKKSKYFSHVFQFLVLSQPSLT